MGYTTDFFGEFKIDKPVDRKTAKLLKGLENTRRMKRNIEGYGVDGEFYIDGEGMMGQGRSSDIVDYNTPPRTQPGLWCKWLLQDDNQTIKWDGHEKFYYYTEWMRYLIDKILSPRGYIVNGRVEWQGEDRHDIGVIIIENNHVKTQKGKIKFIYDD